METLVVIDYPPYGGWIGREALDLAFAMAAFDQPVALLFSGTGVNWLRQGQEAGAIGQKTLTRQLSAAPVFGISELLADQHACVENGLGADQLLPGVKLVSCDEALHTGYQQIICL